MSANTLTRGATIYELTDDERDTMKRLTAAGLVVSCGEFSRLKAVNAELARALTVFALIPLEDFGKQNLPDRPLFGFNMHTVYVRDVLSARAAIAKAKE